MHVTCVHIDFIVTLLSGGKREEERERGGGRERERGEGDGGRERGGGTEGERETVNQLVSSC